MGSARRSINWTRFSSPWARAWDGHEVVEPAVGRLALRCAEEDADEVVAVPDDKTEAVIGELEASTRRRAVRCAVDGFGPDVYIEQPCPTYQECLAVRRQIGQPFVLDESIDDIDTLLRAGADLAIDVVNLKISKLGGLTRTKPARDLCVSTGMAMTLEDSGGGDIVTAAIVHLAHSTAEHYRFTATDFNSDVTVSTAEGAPQRENGSMRASTAPGLGITPRMNVIGPRVVDVG